MKSFIRLGLMFFVALMAEPEIHAQWQQVGNNIPALDFNWALASDNNGTLYVVHDSAYPNPAIVEKYTMSGWVKLGSTQTNYIGGPSVLAFDKNNTPYLMTTRFDTLSVKKFDGSNWMKVGNVVYPGAVNGIYQFMVFDSANTPIVAFLDLNTNFLDVRKFDGVSWQSLHPPVIKFDVSGFQFDAKGTLYLAVSTPSSSPPNMVYKYDGTSWTPADDTAGLSDVANEPMGFYISPAGEHYGFFENSYGIANPRAMKYDTV